jgi:hypothetical protein
MVAGNQRRLRSSLFDTKNGGMRVFWQHLYGDLSGIGALFSGQRTEPASRSLINCHPAYFQYPEEIGHAREKPWKPCS